MLQKGLRRDPGESDDFAGRCAARAFGSEVAAPYALGWVVSGAFRGGDAPMKFDEFAPAGVADRVA